MGTVWVVHPVSLDLGSARNWGTLRYVNDDFTYPDEVTNMGLPAAVAERLVGAAREFSELFDYLLLVGDHLQLMQLGLLLAEQHKSYYVLRWDRIAQGYYQVKMNFSTYPHPLTRRTPPAIVPSPI